MAGLEHGISLVGPSVGFTWSEMNRSSLSWGPGGGSPSRLGPTKALPVSLQDSEQGAGRRDLLKTQTLAHGEAIAARDWM